MSRKPKVCRNSNGGYYEEGRSFTQSKWVGILQQYDALLKKYGKCTVRMLAKEACISLHSANRVINLHRAGLTEMPQCKRGHGKFGIGSKKGFSLEHHFFMYDLYLDNPSMPLYGYCEEFQNKYNIILTEVFVKRWFEQVGPFKGSLRVTSTHPTGRYSDATIMRLQDYISFVEGVTDQSKFVFSDEKPMKEIMIFPRVRKDPITGLTPKNTCSSTSKNRYNILAALNLKGGDVPPVYYEVIEETTTSAIYLQFVKNLIENGVLVAGDFFIVDNCSLHYQGDNVGLAEALRDLFQIHLILLPPYSPELNPTELVFNCLLQRLKAERARYTSIDASDFLDAIKLEMASFDLLDVIRFYKSCGYLK